jgi:hypothetical protein
MSVRKIKTRDRRANLLTIAAITAALALSACGGGPADPSQSGELQGAAEGKADGTYAPFFNYQPPAYAYELTATRTVAGLGAKTIAEKKAVIDQAVDALIARAKKMPWFRLQVGTNGVDRLDFPPMDMDMDGTFDEAAKKLELSFSGDGWMLASTSKAHLVAMRWSLVVYTDKDTLRVVLGVPETFTRLYFRGEQSLSSLVFVASMVHGNLRHLVHVSLKPAGYTTYRNQGIAGTELAEQQIAQLEAKLGPITPESIAPSLTLSGVKAAKVVSAIETAFEAKRLPDLNQDGKVDAADGQVLPSMFSDYMQGKLTFAQMGAMMNQGFSLWKGGYTFQQWANPRTLDLSSPWLGQLHIVELCQPFYARTALTSGLYHIPSMPCAVSVWEEQGKVRVNLLDPNFIFAYLFADAAPRMPPAMQQLFGVFPTFVYNEMAAILNAAMSDLGQSERLPLKPFPQAP